jgi:hypothetical protein
LLYHSDPASPEYDSTQAMAVEVDSIVKSIESEKISEEERMRVRDIWSRIEGVNDKVLLFLLVFWLLVRDCYPDAFVSKRH